MSPRLAFRIARERQKRQAPLASSELKMYCVETEKGRIICDV